jgi:hypothetical protein
MTKPFVKRGARPLIENPDLVPTLAEYLLKVSTDKRFTSGQYKNSTVVLRKLFEEGNMPFEKLCMEAISSNKNENENVNELELAVIKVPDACKLGAANGPINHFKDVILPMMIAGEGDFQFNNEDEKAAILVVLGLKIEGETIIDLKTNAPRKTAAEKLREREQQPENKEKRRAYDQKEEVKAKKREREQQPEKKEKKRARRQERIRLSLREQLRIPPPISSIGEKCTICARTRSVGWKSALKFCSQIEKYFENEGFPEPQGADKTRRFLNSEKTRRGRQRKEEKGGVSSEIDFAHVMCLNCVRKYERSAKMRLDIIRLSAVAAVSVAN